MKTTAPVFEIKRFAVHDGDGIRTTLFLKGCPLRCLWCHNPESFSASSVLAYYADKCISCGACVAVCPAHAHKIQDGVHTFERAACTSCGRCERECLGNALKFYGIMQDADAVLPALTEDKDFYETSGGGVTISGGECLLHADFCAELLQKLKENGISTAIDTCGYVPREAFDRVMPFTDVFLYDVKAIDEEVHKACTGVSNRRILENLLYLEECGKAVEIRVPFVLDKNDDQMEKIAAFLAPLEQITKVRVLPYHNYAGSKYASLGIAHSLPERLPTAQEMEEAKDVFRRYGLTVAD